MVTSSNQKLPQFESMAESLLARWKVLETNWEDEPGKQLHRDFRKSNGEFGHWTDETKQFMSWLHKEALQAQLSSSFMQIGSSSSQSTTSHQLPSAPTHRAIEAPPDIANTPASPNHEPIVIGASNPEASATKRSAINYDQKLRQ